ncbi:MAG: hypothetical protein FJW40_22215 [Acidobacteria bacterium]|nr:hypothetical protein [Acidobacteriota bacterium]
MPEIDLEKIKALTVVIASEVAPDEADLIEAIPANMLVNTRSEALLETIDDFHLGVETEVAMVSVHILAGTLALYESFVSARRIKEEREALGQLREAWQRFLTEKGVSAELAKAIPVKFGSEVLGTC